MKEPCRVEANTNWSIDAVRKLPPHGGLSYNVLFRPLGTALTNAASVFSGMRGSAEAGAPLPLARDAQLEHFLGALDIVVELRGRCYLWRGKGSLLPSSIKCRPGFAGIDGIIQPLENLVEWHSVKIPAHLARNASRDGPQLVTVHGCDEVVVVSTEEFRRLKGELTGKALVELMRSSPLREIDIEPRGARLPIREVSL